MCDLPNSDRLQFRLHPAVVRRNDTSAKSINEWTREKTLRCCSSFLHPCDPQLAMWNLYSQRTCCCPVLCYQALADSVPGDTYLGQTSQCVDVEYGPACAGTLTFQRTLSQSLCSRWETTLSRSLGRTASTR